MNSVLTARHTPTVQVIDLTARLGVFSLAQLGIDAVQNRGPWLQLGLQGTSSPHRLDWHRCATAGQLPPLDQQAAEVWLLVGPGSLSVLEALQGPLSAAPAQTVVRAFYTSNALMEKLLLKRWAPSLKVGVVLTELPDTDPKTLWFVLCEQLSKVPTPAAEADFQDTQTLNEPRSFFMPSNLNASLEAVLTLDGALGVALVDHTSGMCLAKVGGGVDLDLAAAGNTEVVKAKLKTMDMLGIKKGIEDILITLHNQYHLIRLVPNHPGLFLYLVMDKAKGNLALARYKLMDIERSLAL